MAFEINFERVTKEYLSVINRKYVSYLMLKELFTTDIEKKCFEEYYSILLDEAIECYNLLKEDLNNEEYIDNFRDCLFFIEQLKPWHVYDYIYAHNLIKGKLNKSSKKIYTKKDFLKLKDKIFNQKLTDKEVLSIAKHFYLIKVLSNEEITDKENYIFDRFVKKEKMYVYCCLLRHSFYFYEFRDMFEHYNYDEFRIILIREYSELKELYGISFSDEIAYMNLLRIFKCIYKMTFENYIYLKNNNS